MSVADYADLLSHVGHEAEVVAYGDAADPANVAVECVSCQMVLLDFDRDEPPVVLVQAGDAARGVREVRSGVDRYRVNDALSGLAAEFGGRVSDEVLNELAHLVADALDAASDGSGDVEDVEVLEYSEWKVRGEGRV